MDIAGKVKRRLGIPETNIEFDTDIADYVEESLAMLSPIIQREMTTETVTLAADANTVDLTALTGSVRSLRAVEVYNDLDDIYEPYDGFTQHSTTVYIDRSWDEAKTLKLFPLGAYGESNLPIEFVQVIINWSMSEFYSNLVGNSRKYNLYTQASGARKTDNMRDTSDYYWGRGNQLLVDRAKVSGSA